MYLSQEEGKPVKVDKVFISQSASSQGNRDW